MGVKGGKGGVVRVLVLKVPEGGQKGVKRSRCGVLPSGTCCLSICPPLCLRLCLIGIPPERNPSQRDCGLREEEKEEEQQAASSGRQMSDARPEAGCGLRPNPAGSGESDVLPSPVLLRLRSVRRRSFVLTAAWLGLMPASCCSATRGLHVGVCGCWSQNTNI